jgi:hypothetical protein
MPRDYKQPVKRKPRTPTRHSVVLKEGLLMDYILGAKRYD